MTRLDAESKVTGQAQYTADLLVPGALAVRVLRSPYAHARIDRIDASQTAALPGVAAVLTRDDLPADPSFGAAFKAQPILALDRVRYVGEPVAAVAAADTQTAARALELIEVDYTPLPEVLSVEDALADGAPLLH